MDTYSHAYGYTGHYRRPGTQTSYCGRDLLPEPNTGIAKRVCATCTKAEQRDRVAAEQTVADRDLNGPSLAVRAGVRYCLVGTGRRVHYSGNDDTLCGREVTEYTDGLDERHNLLCAPCIKAAEKRAYARALADASPLAAAAVDLAETVEQPAAEQAPAAVRDEPSDWWTIMDPATGEEIVRVHGETWQEMTPRAEALPEVRAVIRKHKGFSRRRLNVSELTPEQRAEQTMAADGEVDAAVEQAAPAPMIVRADQVTAGDTVLGCYPDGTTVKAATVDTVLAHAEPYRAAPTSYRGGAHCQACAVFADHPGPVVTLAVDTPWDMCDPIPAADPVLIRRATAAEREQALADAANLSVDRYIAREFPAVAALLDIDRATDAETDKFDRTARAVDAVEHAEQVEAAVETVEEAEALYAAQLITEADASDGTWQGEWIGEQPHGEALFSIEQDTEQGALFRP
ncbi:hypothetical protein [Streptomyces sp. NPDC017520]|uniref:hypothetical protein n=1 Tax=Streptomyces sp. NPDC017520 TaxID=3364998 RepID=UPI003796D647